LDVTGGVPRNVDRVGKLDHHLEFVGKQSHDEGQQPLPVPQSNSVKQLCGRDQQRIEGTIQIVYKDVSLLERTIGIHSIRKITVLELPGDESALDQLIAVPLTRKKMVSDLFFYELFAWKEKKDYYGALWSDVIISSAFECITDRRIH